MRALRSKLLRRFYVMVEQKGLNSYPEGTDNTPHRRTLNAELNHLIKAETQDGFAGLEPHIGRSSNPFLPTLFRVRKTISSPQQEARKHLRTTD